MGGSSWLNLLARQHFVDCYRMTNAARSLLAAHHSIIEDRHERRGDPEILSREYNAALAAKLQLEQNQNRCRRQQRVVRTMFCQEVLTEAARSSHSEDPSIACLAASSSEENFCQSHSEQLKIRAQEMRDRR